MRQEFLLKIVRAWYIKNKPTFRGFKCGICGKFLYKAWHNWLDFKEFKTPIHLCNRCQQEPKISNSKGKKNNKTKIGPPIDEKIARDIIKKWNICAKPIYKTLTCDLCKKDVYKAYHIWVKLDSTLSEIHFCKKCGHSLGINKK